MEYQYEDSKESCKHLFLLKVLKSYGARTSDMKDFYIAVIRPMLEYGAQEGGNYEGPK